MQSDPTPPCEVFFCSVFFFFQAEDGIRDDLVTGVQTCALPICEATGDGSVTVGGRPFDIAGEADRTGEMTLSVRPEAAQLIVEETPERNVLPGTVVFV